MTEVGFENRLKEINLIQNPEDWHGIVLSAAAGYGKTTLLHKIAEIYQAKQPEPSWKVVWIDIQDRQDVSSIWSYIAKNITDANITGKSEREIWSELRTELANQGKYVLLFDNAGIDKDVTEKLKIGVSKLFDISNIDIHAIFAGRNLSHADWGGQYIHCALDSFDWLIIQRMLYKVGHGDPYASKVDYQKLSVLIYQLSGGHPKAIVKLLDWLKNKRWTVDLTDNSDYETAFHDIDMPKNLKDILSNYDFSETVHQRIRLLCTFRGINLDILCEMQRSNFLDQGTDRFDILQELCEAGYLTRPGIGEVLYRDTIVRGLILSEMIVKDIDRWRELHIMARNIFQSLLKKTSATSLQLVYLVESIYHSLQINNMDWVNTDIRYSNDIGLSQELLNIVNKDLDIRSMVEGIHKKRVEELFENQRPISPGQTETSIEDQYRSSIVAIVDATNSIVGTGFISRYDGKQYVITCAHILKILKKVVGDHVQLRHFDIHLGELGARVKWLQSAVDLGSNNGNAKQDIAVLELIEPLLDLTPLQLKDCRKCSDGKKDCWCYGYLEGTMGDWIKGISCEYRLADGFCKLSQSGKNRIRPGASGAPVCHEQGSDGVIIGMVYGFKEEDEETAYLIPSEIILEVLSSLNQGA